MNPYLKTESGKLYHGDCLGVMSQLETKFDLCLTDPPYGIKQDKGFSGFSGFGGFGKPIARKQYIDNWDKKRPSKDIFDLILNKANKVLIFGGNFFADLLPQSTHWIVWDKKNTMPTFSDAELIWTNIKRNSVKIKTFTYNGLIGKDKTIRVHPTQKPVELIEILLTDYSNKNDLILDPFLGSGTTAIACENLNRRWVGIEKEEKYCEIAAKRIEQTVNQMRF